MSIILPIAGHGRRIKPANRSLIRLTSGETILARQLRILQKVHRRAEIIVVVGYEADKIIEAIPPGIKVVENELHDCSGAARSIAMGLRVASGDNLLIVYGDLIFNEKAISTAKLGFSNVVVSNGGLIGRDEIGVNTHEGRVAHFDYGLKTKWAQIAFLAKPEASWFRKFIIATKNTTTQEALNKTVEAGTIRAVEPLGMKIVEIDTHKDLVRANASFN